MKSSTLFHTLALGGISLLAGPLLAQTQEAKLTATNGKSGDRLGAASSLDGATAMLGAPDDRANQVRSGSVFVFTDNGSSWGQVQRLNPTTPENNDFFGEAVDLDGDFAVVGASGVDLPTGGGFGQPDADWGAAYVFERSAGVWSQVQELTASDDDPYDYFGTSVAISGDTLVVGARAANKGGLASAGAAYVFVRGGGGGWSQQAKLNASNGQNLDSFGSSVDIDGDRIVVGAQLGDGNAADSGSAYVFERSGTVWTQTAILNASNGATNDRFGGSVALSGDNIVVGARIASPGGLVAAGAAYAYRQSAGLWSEEAILVASDVDPADLFGSSVSISGESAAVGAPSAGVSLVRSGAVYVFDRAGGAWNQAAKLVAGDAAPFDSLGASVATDGTLYLAGTPNGDGSVADSGAGYLFSVGGSLGTPYCFCVTGVCSNPDSAAGCRNSTGAGALLSASGSASASADDLVLSATGVAPNQFGLVFMGMGQSAVPFGDGLRCVAAGGGEIYRFPIRNSGGAATLVESGLVGLSQSFNAGGQIGAGQSWNFQSWYRDPGGPCSSGFNLSNGLSITFQP